MKMSDFQLLAAAALFAAHLVAADARAAILVQDFNDVAEFPVPPPGGPGNFCPQSAPFVAAGWQVINNSEPSPFGSTWCVSQGYPVASGVFPPDQSFPSLAGDDAFAGLGWWSTWEYNRPISLWMISPTVEFGAGATLEFWTRHVTDPTATRDRLQVRLGPAGPANVGTAPADVGQFTDLLLDINPNQQGDFTCPPDGIVADPPASIPGYPQTWCRVRLPLQLAAGFRRIAFRYYSAGGASIPPRQLFIGVDSVRFDPGEFAPPSLRVDESQSTFEALGGRLVGETGTFTIPVILQTPGTGDAVTTLEAEPMTPPFRNFTSVSAQGSTLSANAITGECVRGDTGVDRTVQFYQAQGAQPPIPITMRTLRCGRGVGRTQYNRYADTVRADDPRIYWRLGEDSGNALNSATGPSSVGSIGVGVLSGTSPYERRQPPVMPYGSPNDFAIRIQTSSDLRFSSGAFDKLPAGADGITFELWLRDDGAIPNQYTNLVGDRQATLGNSFAFLYRAPGNSLRMHVMTTNGLMSVNTASNTIAASSPQHVAATWSAVTGEIRIYVDGVELPTTVVAGSNPTTGTPVNTAANPIYSLSDLAEILSASTTTFDEVAVYSHVLSAERIRVHNDVGRSFGDGFGD